MSPRLPSWRRRAALAALGLAAVSALAPAAAQTPYPNKPIRLVVGNGEGEHHASGGCSVHNPGYDFNDAILPIAASYWVQLARRFLAPGA